MNFVFFGWYSYRVDSLEIFGFRYDFCYLVLGKFFYFSSFWLYFLGMEVIFLFFFNVVVEVLMRLLCKLFNSV